MYDPKVSVIWEIIRDFFESRGCPIDVTFYSTTSCRSTRCSTAHRHRLELAAGVARRAAPLRRDVPRDRDARHRPRPRLVHRRDERTGRFAAFADLRGRGPRRRRVRLAAGDADPARPPAGRNGLEPRRDVTVRRFDVLVGKHGDHVGGELDAFGCLQRGEADACAMLDLNWEPGRRDGTIESRRVRASSPRPSGSITASSPSAAISTADGRAPLAGRAVLDAATTTRRTAR